MAGVDVKCLSVGKVYPDMKTGQDGYVMEWDEFSGLSLYCFMCNMRPEEVVQFDADNPFEIAFTVIEDVCFFAVKFGGLMWGDCPFSPAIYKAAGREKHFPLLLEAGVGLAVNVLVYDTLTGVLENIRLVGLGHEFSQKWLDWVREAERRPLSMAEYNNRIDRVYQKYSSEDIAQKAKREGLYFRIN